MSSLRSNSLPLRGACCVPDGVNVGRLEVRSFSSVPDSGTITA
jgi:hypothetical protein